MKIKGLRESTGRDGFPRYTAHVVGTSFSNDDGSSRQGILRKLYRYQEDTGSTDIVSVWLEVDEHEGEPAVRVVSDYGVCGFLAADTAAELVDLPGYVVDVDSWEIFGGPTEEEPGKNYGMAVTLLILTEEQDAQRLDQLRAAARDRAPSAAPAPAEEPVRVTVVPESSPCRKSVTLVLCFLLGVIGGHRFYTGRILSGALSLFYGAAWAKLFLIDRVQIGGDSPLATIFAVILPLWWLVDVIRITTGYYTDKAGRRITE